MFIFFTFISCMSLKVWLTTSTCISCTGVKNQISEKIGKIKIFFDRSIPLDETSRNPKRFFNFAYLFTN